MGTNLKRVGGGKGGQAAAHFSTVRALSPLKSVFKDLATKGDGGGKKTVDVMTVVVSEKP